MYAGSGKTFPTFPTFPGALIFLTKIGGTLRGTLVERRLTFPFFGLGRVRKTFPTFPFEGELPAARLMGNPDRLDARLQSGDVEHPVAHARECLAQARALGPVAAHENATFGLQTVRDVAPYVVGGLVAVIWVTFILVFVRVLVAMRVESPAPARETPASPSRRDG